MHFQIYTRSTDAWDAMFSAIENAKKSILFEMYIFVDDISKKYDFVSLLEMKAKAGLEVIMILDAFGCLDLSNQTVERLQKAGVEVLFFRHWIHHTHRKLIIIDHEKALLGGVNIVRHAMNWQDLLLEISGTLVRKLARTFFRTYHLAGGLKKINPFNKKKKRKYRIRMWIMEHTPMASRWKLKKYYLKKIHTAKKSLHFVTPYFVPRKWLETALQKAVVRGVEVNIILPKNSDLRLFDMLNIYYADRAAQYGVKIYQSAYMNHAKAILIDETEAMIGSANLDSLSFEFNNEIGIFFTEKEIVKKLSKIIHKWKNEGILYQAEGISLPWYYKVLGIVLRVLNPIL